MLGGAWKQVLELLLKSGADRTVMARVGAEDFPVEKWTPLKIARFNGESDEAAELLKRGINGFKSRGAADKESDDPDVPEEYIVHVQEGQLS